MVINGGNGGKWQNRNRSYDNVCTLGNVQLFIYRCIYYYDVCIDFIKVFHV
jgi:hypothetical protein